MVIDTLSVHHFGGLGQNRRAKTGHLTLPHIEAAHARRHFPISELGYHTGYNIIIWRDGTFTQVRKIGEQTAAVRGHNFHICAIAFAGNFNAGSGELPTTEQKNTFQRIAMALIQRNPERENIKVKQGARYNFNTTRIYPHRYHSNTECYGSSLPDNWARDLIAPITDPRIEILKQMIVLYRQILDRLMRQRGLLAGDVNECYGFH